MIPDLFWGIVLVLLAIWFLVVLVGLLVSAWREGDFFASFVGALLIIIVLAALVTWGTEIKGVLLS